MSDPENPHLDNNEGGKPVAPAPWQTLLHSVGQNALAIADEIMSDAVLGESITSTVASYQAHHEKLIILREKFAASDQLCAQLRREARELMRQSGYDFEWDHDDIEAVDAQLAITLKEAGEHAAAINKMRSEASTLDNHLLGRAVDEIALCASISVLRNIEKYSCEGEAFCVAYIATALVRERSLGDLPLKKANDALADWLQYSIGVKTRVVEFDIYSHSRIASGIGRGMGISNSVALRIALIEAMKKGRAA